MHAQQPRSRFIPTLLTFSLAAAFALPAGAAEYVRQSVTDFNKDPAKVKAFKTAMTKMHANNNKKRDTVDFYNSWEYWANTHGWLGTGPNAAGTAATYVKRTADRNCPGSAMGEATCRKYYVHLKDSTLPNDGFTNQVWGTCQHGSNTFLPWHRMYLHYFERTLRKLSGDANFALPYWNYFGEMSKGGLQLPALVRGKSAVPFYDEWRTPGLNENTTTMDAQSASAAQAFRATTFLDFQRRIEGQPHGSMHCAVGSGCAAPDIGQVPLAGWDPVFYMHHANIDRLWQCWMVQKAGGKTIDLAWAKANLGMPDAWYQTEYVFADENGQKATMKIEDLFKPGVIESRYDNDKACQISPPTVRTALIAGTDVPGIALDAAKAKGTVSLKGKQTLMEFDAPQKLTRSAESAAEAKPAPVHLVLENVDIVGNPGVSYKVFLASKADPKRMSYVATISYFGKLEPTGHDHPHADGSTGKIGTLRYDVTENMHELSASSAADVSVQFVPSNLTTKKVVEKTTQGSVTMTGMRLENAPEQK
ncbi:tyrosinase family protein [Massilia sp. W12]|uniref:tyrosinase family protein n=1 Tax=Massilia sp. W12 TaxID=3126507 RepID=UPI0030D0D5C9